MPKPQPANVSPKVGTHIRLDAALRAGLETIRMGDGVGYTEQIQRAIRLWLDAQGLGQKRQVR